MANGGMIQYLKDDGVTWVDCFPTGYKPEFATLNVAHKYGTRARLVSRDGEVLFDTGAAE